MKTVNKKVVIIDDNKVVAEVLKFQIEKCLNYQTFTFSKAIDGIDFMRENNVDFLILDYQLDNKEHAFCNGSKVINYLFEKKINTPTILVSSQDDIATATLLIKSGIIDYINKNSKNYIFKLIESIKAYEKYVLLIRQTEIEEKEIKLRYLKIAALAATLLGFIISISV